MKYKEHDTVVAIKGFNKIPVGAVGVIISIYEISDNLLEVEFNVDGETIIQTMTREEIKPKQR